MMLMRILPGISESRYTSHGSSILRIMMKSKIYAPDVLDDKSISESRYTIPWVKYLTDNNVIKDIYRGCYDKSISESRYTIPWVKYLTDNNVMKDIRPGC